MKTITNIQNSTRPKHYLGTSTCLIYFFPTGKFNLDSRNAWTFKEKFKYYSVIKALLKVMETSTPAPEDVNTLLGTIHILRKHFYSTK